MGLSYISLDSVNSFQNFQLKIKKLNKNTNVNKKTITCIL